MVVLELSDGERKILLERFSTHEFTYREEQVLLVVGDTCDVDEVLQYVDDVRYSQECHGRVDTLMLSHRVVQSVEHFPKNVWVYDPETLDNQRHKQYNRNLLFVVAVDGDDPFKQYFCPFCVFTKN